MKKRMSMIAIAVLSLTMVACGVKEVNTVVSPDEDFATEVTLEGLGDEAIVLDLDTIKELPIAEVAAQSLTSDGEIKVADIKGVYVKDILSQNGYDIANYESLKITAGDGYEILVPPDVLSTRDVILAFEENGITYDKYGAFRSIIPDERAMYWVKGVANLNFEANIASSGIEQIVFLDNLSQVMELEDYTYYETVEKAVAISDLIETFAIVEDETTATLLASDGLEDDKDLTTVENSYLKLTGEDAPLFTAPDLPKGMQIKGIAYLKVGNTAFVSISAMTEVPTFKEVLAQSGVEGTSYIAYDVEGTETVIGAGIAGNMEFVIEGDSLYLVNNEESIKINISKLGEEKEN